MSWLHLGQNDHNEIIKDAYTKETTVVQVWTHKTNPITIKREVKESCPLSTLLKKLETMTEIQWYFIGKPTWKVKFEKRTSAQAIPITWSSSWTFSLIRFKKWNFRLEFENVLIVRNEKVSPYFRAINIPNWLIAQRVKPSLKGYVNRISFLESSIFVWHISYELLNSVPGLQHFNSPDTRTLVSCQQHSIFRAVTLFSYPCNS